MLVDFIPTDDFILSGVLWQRFTSYASNRLYNAITVDDTFEIGQRRISEFCSIPVYNS